MNKDIKWALDAISKNMAECAVPRMYYGGKQPLAFAGEKFREAFGAKFRVELLRLRAHQLQRWQAAARTAQFAQEQAQV